MAGREPRLLQCDQLDEDSYRELWAAVKSSGRWQGEICSRRADGSNFIAWITVSTVFRDDGVQRLMVVLGRNEAPVSLPLDRFAEGLRGATMARDVFAGTPVAPLGDALVVPAHAAQVYELCPAAVTSPRLAGCGAG